MLLVVELKFITIGLLVFLILQSLVSTFAKAPFYFKPALALGNLQTYKVIVIKKIGTPQMHYT